MSKLEDLLPELAGVFAAQESAMESVVSMLTTQVAQLIQENDRQSSRVASLEDTHQQFQDALLTMRKAHDALENHQRQEHSVSTETVDALVASVEHLRGKFEREISAIGAKYETVASQLEVVGAGPSEAHVVGLLSDHLASVETKLAAHMEQRLLEMSNRSYWQTQQTEEAMKTELEQLEKKFDYLSRVKMEIKDLGKKIDKQDQTLDDMRMGMELLAKSIGTDEDEESDSESAGREEASGESPSHKPLRPRVDKTEQWRLRPRCLSNMPSLGFHLALQFGPPSDKQAADNTEVSSQPDWDTIDDGDLSPASDEVDNAMNAVTAESATSPPEDTVAAENPSDPLDEATELVLGPSPPPNETWTDANGMEPVDPATGGEGGLSQSLEPSLESDRSAADVVLDSRPTPASEPPSEEADAALEEAEESDHVVDILPSQTSRSRLTSRDLLHQLQPLEEPAETKAFRPATGPVMHHMVSTPNFTTAYSAVTSTSTAMIRSRRITRLQKRTSSSRLRESADSARSEARTPLAKETVKELWRRMFARFVQLKRLQNFNGGSPERIFRKQNLSVGARVKRLEESANDLEEMVDALEGNIQQNSQSVQALSHGLTLVDARVDQLGEHRVAQGQMIVGLEEKLELIEIDLRRARSSSRRDSSQSAASTNASALTLQLTNHVATFESLERVVRRLCESDLPALASKFEAAMRDFRGEQDHKSKELAKELRKSLDRAHEAQMTAQARLQERTNGFVERLYRDIMTLSKAHLVSLELVRASTAQQRHAHSDAGASSSSDGAKKTAPFDAGVDMLHAVFAGFEDDCRAATQQPTGQDEGDDAQDASVLTVLLERASEFRSELSKLKEQAEKAKHSPVLAFSEDESSSSGANFVERLALISNAQLRAFEALVPPANRDDRSLQADNNGSSGLAIPFRVQDLVVQLRCVLSLLLLHAELLDPHRRLAVVLSAQDALQHEVRAHAFSIAQLSTTGAMVKMMNSRLDAFLELSFSFAKDEDVKNSIQEMLSSSDSVHTTLSQQLEAAHSEAQQRDEVLEHEFVQLVARVNKKLDKDELLWTQEVIERQLQSVAKSSLGESDLVDLHRLLRNKLDKSYFNALLLEQRTYAAAGGGGVGSGGSGGAAPGSTPLVGAKCISCNSELPPTKAMIKSVVKEQVQQEVHKALARQQQQQQQQQQHSGAAATPLAASPSSFHASTHRSVEKYKKELLAAATQQQQQQQQRRR
ncbi:hypothetical protein PybrP1_008687 [[Pythium] brassicae (nom. inval.)]|nr:hypothetical protein PybrP1_008687 [[Pythium] brassicae (nom. inval.)]